MTTDVSGETNYAHEKWVVQTGSREVFLELHSNGECRAAMGLTPEQARALGAVLAAMAGLVAL
jgi:hypothetical protein